MDIMAKMHAAILFDVLASNIVYDGKIQVNLLLQSVISALSNNRNCDPCANFESARTSIEVSDRLTQSTNQ